MTRSPKVAISSVDLIALSLKLAVQTTSSEENYQLRFTLRFLPRSTYGIHLLIMPLSLSDLQANPASFLGPPIVSLFVEAIQTGILLKQSVTFWERAETESTAICIVVAIVTLVAL